MLRARRPGTAWLALALAWLAWLPLAGRGDDGGEAGLKAAYLVRFLGYVDWPAQAFAAPDSPQVIGVIGADAVFAALQRVAAGQRGAGRPVLARRLEPGDALDGVHLLHVGREVALAVLSEALAGRPVLVVTDTPAGLDGIAALNFRRADRRLRFEASVPAAERAGLKLSARLLAVAERVIAP